MGIIYVLHNEENDKCYVGQTTRTFEERFGAHKIFSSLIGKALRKYGVDNFSKIILENIPEEESDSGNNVAYCQAVQASHYT